MGNIYLYNTLNRRKEEFSPLNPPEVSFYVCGPTVYDYFHIGNARVFIVFDVIRRYLEYCGYKVTYVQNFTDIDDKVIKKAEEMNLKVNELTEKFINAYFADANSLKIKQASIHPKATEHINPIIELIQKLFEQDIAYMSEGDILFDTQKVSNYGKLSHQKKEDLLSGARVEVDENKRNPLDFVLWKSAKPGEPSWESPWGRGRPGWHIECSAMAMCYLGETIDIHAGGPDLVFPHHENEIAQSEGATGSKFVNYWLHAGYLNIEEEKMSKSLGNVLNIREILSNYNPLDLRFFMLSAHYRSPLNYSDELINSASTGRERLQTLYDNVSVSLERAEDFSYGAAEKELAEQLTKAKEDFKTVMNDDFNTAEALGVLFTLVREVNVYLSNKNINKELLASIKSFFREVNDILNIIEIDEKKDLEDRIKKAIEKREEARRQKDYSTADLIRDELKAEGIILEDTPYGVRWKFSKSVQ